MPAAPLRACVYGCPERSHPGPCPKRVTERERERQRAIGRQRGSASSRGYGSRHRRWRHVILARDPVCKLQARFHPGTVVASNVADHIVPLSQGGTWSLSNGRGICTPCHGKISVEQGVGGFRRGPEVRVKGEGGRNLYRIHPKDHAGWPFARADRIGRFDFGLAGSVR